MTRRFALIVLLAAGLAAVLPASAHENYRIIGTVVKANPYSIEVRKTKDGKVVMIDIDKATVVTRNKKKVAPGELKAGLSVVVDAEGDSLDELVAMQVRIVGGPAAK